jgi:hypothetical protein
MRDRRGRLCLRGAGRRRASSTPRARRSFPGYRMRMATSSGSDRIMRIPTPDILTTTVQMTVVGGEVVYEQR